ncbi:MAG: haloacid dehalogenase-like hydrolase [Peptoniphilaceae bacterium]|nr:haloacid dehalogenase-like hydrolase [Peptoniphilaceae bacterium]MDD7382802.1 haloacid dehalogenase-like hydrolase [Peptoniphilaceae bacterium]MDY3737960.1 haloacid dehalogenase-like hydrolase [Peptoniphilaceae bacterium]
MKRFLDSKTSEILSMKPDELKESIRASEGRVILSENNVVLTQVQPMITNSEVARAFGADLILLNLFDVFNCKVNGIDESVENPVKELRRLTGRPIGVNLEPVDPDAEMMEEKDVISNGRICSLESIKKANELGFDMICLTGNPSTGVTNKQISKAIKLTKENFDGLVIAGKMHGSGVGEPIIDEETVEDFINSGADVILIPAVGTFPGLTVESMKKITDFAHSKGALVMSAIGTSQEASSKETIKQLALLNKMVGVDIQHIGDAGFSGLAPFKNITELSIALRGESLTIRMIASSILR